MATEREVELEAECVQLRVLLDAQAELITSLELLTRLWTGTAWLLTVAVPGTA